MSLGVTLLGVDEMREFGRVSDEEDGSVVEHPVKVALLRSDFKGKAAGITGGIRRSEFTTDGGETGSGTVFLADLSEEPGRGNVAEVVGQFKVTMCTSTLGVNLVVIVRSEQQRNYLCSERTTRSGIRSRSKWARRSMWWKSEHIAIRWMRYLERGSAQTLEKEGADGANALSCVWLCDNGAIWGGVGSTVFAVDNLCRRHFERWEREGEGRWRYIRGAARSFSSPLGNGLMRLAVQCLT